MWRVSTRTTAGKLVSLVSGNGLLRTGRAAPIVFSRLIVMRTLGGVLHGTKWVDYERRTSLKSFGGED